MTVDTNNPASGPTNSTTSGSPMDIFDNEAAFALPQNYVSAGAKKVHLRVTVKKPAKQMYVRVHPEPEYRRDVFLIEYGEDREMYLVPTAVSADVSGFARPYRLYVYITRQNTLGLWPIRLVGADGRSYDWWTTAHEAAAEAMKGWIRIEPDMAAGSNNIYVPQDPSVMLSPEWPDLAMPEILRLAFKDRVIEGPDHIVLKKLRGAA